MEYIRSHEEFIEKNEGAKKSFLLLFRSGSESSQCAFQNLVNSQPQDNGKFKMFVADVSSVRDIHPHYGIASVPSLLIFQHGEYINVIKGCQTTEFYRGLAESAFIQAQQPENGKPAKRVTVYSTPSCPWCNTLKTFLRKHNIYFTDVDVSKDQSAAQDLVRRSGQQGVPQTEINGEIVVGFDQLRLRKLLEI